MRLRTERLSRTEAISMIQDWGDQEIDVLIGTNIVQTETIHWLGQARDIHIISITGGATGVEGLAVWHPLDPRLKFQAWVDFVIVKRSSVFPEYRSVLIRGLMNDMSISGIAR